MDVTNPGLVNVADQAFKPDLKVDSLAVPKDDDTLVPVADEGEPPAPNNPASQAVPFNDDTLVPVADQGEPRAENDVISSIVPVPAESIVAAQAAVPVSQDFGEVPGVAPAFLPFPPGPNDQDIAKQDLTAGNVSDFTVAGPDISIQTNQSAETQKNYAVTAVLDADTGLPPTVPISPTTGTFSAMRSGGTGIVTVISPTTFPPVLVDSLPIAIAGTPVTYDGIYSIDNVLSLAGNFDIAVNPLTGKTTLGSLAALPAALANAKWITISGSSVASYNGIHQVSNIISRNAHFSNIEDNSSVIPGTIVVMADSPTGLADNQLISISNTTIYDGFHTVVAGSVNDAAGSFSSVSDAGGNVSTIHVLGSTTGLTNGQWVQVTSLTGGLYTGQFKIQNVQPSSFDIVCSFSATATGTWTTYTFIIDGAYQWNTDGIWASNIFDIDVAYAGTPAGTPAWQVRTFDIPGTYSVTSSGTWTYTPPQPPPTTRYRLTVAPADLSSFGISMLGRPIVFDDVIPTVANEGASRDITGYGSNFVVIDRSDEADQLVPIMDNPQAGDTFNLDVQRQGSEVISRDTGTVEDVTILPPPQVNLPTGIPSAPSQGNIEVSTGPQPGDPVITSGVNVPTAITVNIADQDLVGPGLPKDVFP